MMCSINPLIIMIIIKSLPVYMAYDIYLQNSFHDPYWIICIQPTYVVYKKSVKCRRPELVSGVGNRAEWAENSVWERSGERPGEKTIEQERSEEREGHGEVIER